MTRGRMQGTHGQLLRLRDTSFRDAEKALRTARNTRKAAQDTARNIQEKQWLMEMHSDATEGYWFKLRTDKPNTLDYLERSMLRDLGIARDEEAKAEELLLTARRAAEGVARFEKKLSRREEPGWVTLIRMCLLGRRNKRARRERSLYPSYHLQ